MSYASSGYFMKQPWSNKNVFVMSRGKVLRQSILPRVQPAKLYQFAFKVKLAEDVEQVHMRIIMRVSLNKVLLPADMVGRDQLSHECALT